MEDKRSEIMAKVQKLLAKAESTSYGPEQEALLQKADRLMVDYAIAQHEIDALAKPGEKAKPEVHNFIVCEEGNHLWDELTDLAATVVSFFDCKAAYSGYSLKGRTRISCKAVGFPESLRAAEQLYTSLKIQMMATIHPKWDPLRSEADNIVAMKDAGQTWSYIFLELKRVNNPLGDGVEERNKLGRIKRIYDKRKMELGEEPVKVNPKNFQVNFAQGFTEAISGRCREIKKARQTETQNETTSAGTSVALVLADRNKEVVDFFQQTFPSLSFSSGRGSSKYNGSARSAGHRAGSNADLSGATRNVGGSRGAIGR